MRRLVLFYLLALGCGVFVRSHPKDDDFAEFEDDEEFETDVFDGDSEDGEYMPSKCILVTSQHSCTSLCAKLYDTP